MPWKISHWVTLSCYILKVFVRRTFLLYKSLTSNLLRARQYFVFKQTDLYFKVAFIFFNYLINDLDGFLNSFYTQNI